MALKTIIRCNIRGVPVEVEIEGPGLDPTRMGDILDHCLKSTDAELKKRMLKKDGEEAGQPGLSTGLEVTSTVLLPRPQETTP